MQCPAAYLREQCVICSEECFLFMVYLRVCGLEYGAWWGIADRIYGLSLGDFCLWLELVCSVVSRKTLRKDLTASKYLDYKVDFLVLGP